MVNWLCRGQRVVTKGKGRYVRLCFTFMPTSILYVSMKF